MKKSFTLMEVVVGAIILALVFGGLIAALVGARSYVKRADKRLISVNLIRKGFDELYPVVRADTWDNASNPLYAPACSGGTCAWEDHTASEIRLDASPNIESIGYQVPDYKVRRIANHDYREAEITINFPEK